MTCWCFKSQSVLKLRSETLSELALAQNIRLARNATKAAKIRALANSPNVKSNCSPDELQSIENALVAMEEKKKSQKKKNNRADSEDEEEDTASKNKRD